jgi:hypothetical protein
VKPLKFFNLLANLLFAAAITAVVLATGIEAHPLALFAGFFVGASLLRIASIFFMMLEGSHTHRASLLMAVQTEVWEEMIAENLFKDYAWIKRAKDRSGFVLDNKVVHIPQAGLKPNASKNRETFPLPIVKRNDTDVTYPIDQISTDATHIPDADKIELSYDKISSVVKDHFGVLSEVSARDILDRWYPATAAKMVRTTGTATAAYLTGQTGNRKKFLALDVAAAKTLLILQTKRETGNRILICTEGAYNQLKADPTVTDKDTMDSVGAVWSNGDLIKLHGMDIVRTDVTSRYDNTATPVKRTFQDMYEQDYAATDNDVALVVDLNYVHFALGNIKFFENLNDAQYQGDIYSALVRLGGRLERNDEVGVVAIIQEP